MRSVGTAVIGAGFSGLSAALALRDGGEDVLVLEAQDKPGGRTKTTMGDDGIAYDLGGQFYCRAMPSVAGLVDHYGLTRRDIRKDEGAIALIGGERKRLDADFLELALFDRLHDADPHFPGSLGDWVASLGLDPEESAMIHSGCEEIMGRPIDQVSFRSVLECVNTFEDVENTMEYCCAEGMGTLAQRMADDLGERFLANTPVSAVDRVNGSFILSTPQGSIAAHRVIYAASPVVLGQITWRADQDRWLRELPDRFVAGHMRKIVLRYATAFWRDSDFGWVGQTDSPAGLNVMDCSDPDDQLCLLTVFCGGTAAMALEGMNDEDALSTVLDIIEPMLGPAVRDPITTVQENWSGHPWVGGGYATWARPWEAEDPWAPLRSAHDGMYFAVAELGSSFAGHIEGAVRSGRDTATRLLSDARSR